MYVLNTGRLVEDLAHGRVSARDKTYYLLAGWVLYVAIGYSTVVFSNQGRTWLGAFEMFMIIVIAVLGMQRCYEASGGDSSKHFIVDFTCLLVPLTIKIYVVVWGLYWLFAWGVHIMLRAVESGTYTIEEAPPKYVGFILTHGGWFVTLLAVLASQAALFLRMAVHMSQIAKLRETSNPLMQPTGRERPAAD